VVVMPPAAGGAGRSQASHAQPTATAASGVSTTGNGSWLPHHGLADDVSRGYASVATPLVAAAGRGSVTSGSRGHGSTSASSDWNAVLADASPPSGVPSRGLLREIHTTAGNSASIHGSSAIAPAFKSAASAYGAGNIYRTAPPPVAARGSFATSSHATSSHASGPAAAMQGTKPAPAASGTCGRSVSTAGGRGHGISHHGHGHGHSGGQGGVAAAAPKAAAAAASGAPRNDAIPDSGMAMFDDDAMAW
jgi:hypothetical protein